MYTLGICADFVNLPDAHELGYDFLEVSLAQLAALSDAEFEEFADYAAAVGLKLRSASDMLPEALSITGPKVSATALHAYLKAAFDRARILGIRVICLDAAKSRSVPLDIDFPFAWRQLGNFLRLVQGHAKENGIHVAIEPIRASECNLVNLVSEAGIIAGMLQLQNVGVAADWGHMSMASEPMSSLRRTAPLLRHVHVESALARRMPAEGDGEDYPRLMRALNSIDYRGGVCVRAQHTDDFRAEAAAALRCLRAAGPIYEGQKH